MFSAWRFQKLGCATRRASRSSGVIFSASVVDLQRREETVGRLVAAGLAHLLAEHGVEFEPVAVAVDDRVLQLGVNLLWALMAAHDFLP